MMSRREFLQLITRARLDLPEDSDDKSLILVTGYAVLVIVFVAVTCWYISWR